MDSEKIVTIKEADSYLDRIEGAIVNYEKYPNKRKLSRIHKSLRELIDCPFNRESFHVRMEEITSKLEQIENDS
jgi:hypothetical protein